MRVAGDIRDLLLLWIFDENQLFRLIEVGDMAILIDTSSEVAGSSSVPRSATDEGYLDVPTVKESRSCVEC